jgi:hypothetical protein
MLHCLSMSDSPKRAKQRALGKVFGLVDRKVSPSSTKHQEIAMVLSQSRSKYAAIAYGV